MSTTEFERVGILAGILEIAMHGVIAGCVAVLLFGMGSRSAKPGFRMFPSSAAEWVAYCIHTLEFVQFCAALVAFQPASRYMLLLNRKALLTTMLAAAVLLLLGAVAFWRTERSVCKAAIIWSMISLVVSFFAYPALNAVYER